MGRFSNPKPKIYDNDVAIIKKYGNFYKITQCNVLRNKGYDLPSDHDKKPKFNDNDLPWQFPEYENYKKSFPNISRSKNTILEYAYCNPWDLFCTFTLDPKKYDSYNLDKFRKDFTQFLRNLRRNYSCDIKYLFIPEKHKSGAWHIHGFLYGVPEQLLRKFTLKEKLPTYIRNKLKEGGEIYDFPKYRERFGFCDLEKIRDLERSASYITKYITKDLAFSVCEYNANMYYCSTGLKKAAEVVRGHLQTNVEFTFENEYCKIKWVSVDDPEAEKIIKHCI